MKISNTVIWLSALIILLALLAAGIGFFYQDAGSPINLTTPRGETVQLYGQGLYAYETVRDAIGFKGSDLFVMFVAVPLLTLATWLYRRGSLRGGLLLTGTLAYFLYNSASMTFGYAYNNLFIIYLAQFSASLLAAGLAFTSFDVNTLATHFSEHLPRRAIAAFLLAVGASLIFVWGVMDILPALLAGQVPALNGHTTLPTHALDMGVIAPLAVVAGVLLLRRAPFGYLLAAVLLVVSSVLGAGVLALSTEQVIAQVLTPAQTIVFVVPFVILTAFGVLLTSLLLRNFGNSKTYTHTTLRTAHA